MTRASTFYKRSYTNGYQEKIQYYLNKYDIALLEEDLDSMRFFKKKLSYFMAKQEEYLSNKYYNLLRDKAGVIEKK
jgi:uncharacterized membrane protein